MSYKQQYQEKFHEVAMPKWKRSPLSHQVFDSTVAKAAVRIENDNENILVSSLEDVTDEKYIQLRSLKGANHKSLGDKFESYITGFGENALFILSKHTRMEMPIVKVHYKLSESNSNYPLEQLIVAEAGSKLTVIIDLSSTASDVVQYFGKTKVVAYEGAHIKLVKIQRLEDQANIFDLNVSQVEEGGKVEVVDLQIGGGYKAVSHESNLMGRHAYSQMKSAYYGEGNQKLDLSYTMSHQAKMTESVILAKGALADKAQKVFRGNLYFATGASESIGKEQEFVTMLSSEAHTDSFPALMCSEDDVVGEHAASIGQVDEDKLFYLMSRGLSEIEAKRLLVKASFDEVIGEIEDESLENILYTEIERRIS